MPQVELVEDDKSERVYRVEAIYANGSCEVAIFSGPNSDLRSEFFMKTYYNVPHGDPPYIPRELTRTRN